MSRSRRKSPFTGVTAAVSDKEFKKHSSRVLRKKQKQVLRKADVEGLVLPTRNAEAVDRWSSPKEGKSKLDLSQPRDRRQMRK